MIDSASISGSLSRRLGYSIRALRARDVLFDSWCTVNDHCHDGPMIRTRRRLRNKKAKAGRCLPSTQHGTSGEVRDAIAARLSIAFNNAKHCWSQLFLSHLCALT